jgi:hypothetical protein
VARLVHHLGGGVVLGVHARHLLHDLARADEGALLAVEELGDLPRLHVMTQIRALRLRQPLPHRRPEDRDRHVGQARGILGVEVLRPVDALLRVPLQPLGLAVEVEKAGAAVLVLPVEAGLEVAGDRPVGVGGHGVAVERAHRASVQLMIFLSG